MVRLVKELMDNTSFTEPETMEIIAILLRKGVNLAKMEVNQAIDYVVDKTEIHSNRMCAWLNCKLYYNSEEFTKMAHDLRSGRCLVFYTNEVNE